MKNFKVILTTLLILSIATVSHAVKLQFSNDETLALEEVRGSDGRLNTSARSDERSFYVSRDDGQVYTFNSEYTASDGDEVLYIKNTSTTKKLFISFIIMGGDHAIDWEVIEVTSGTAAGTTVTPKNLNLTSSNDAEATVFGNAAVTGSLTGDLISHVRSTSAESVTLSYGDALILGQNDDIAINYESVVNGPIDVTVGGFFE